MKTKNNKLKTKKNKLKTKKQILIGGRTHITPNSYPTNHILTTHEIAYRYNRSEILKLQKMRYVLQTYSRFKDVEYLDIIKVLHGYIHELSSNNIQINNLLVEKLPPNLQSLPNIHAACDMVNMQIVTETMDSVLKIAQDKHIAELKKLINESSPSEPGNINANLRLREGGVKQLFIGHHKLYGDNDDNIDYLQPNNSRTLVTNEVFSQKCKQFAEIDLGIKNALENNVIKCIGIIDSPNDDNMLQVCTKKNKTATPTSHTIPLSGPENSTSIHTLPSIGEPATEDAQAHCKEGLYNNDTVFEINLDLEILNNLTEGKIETVNKTFCRNTNQSLYDKIGIFFSNRDHMKNLNKKMADGKDYTNYLNTTDIFRFYILEYSNTYLSEKHKNKCGEWPWGEKHSDNFGYTLDTMPMVNCKLLEVNKKEPRLAIGGLEGGLQWGVKINNINSAGEMTYNTYFKEVDIKYTEAKQVGLVGKVQETVWNPDKHGVNKETIYTEYYRLKNMKNNQINKEILEIYKDITNRLNKFKADNKHKVTCCLYPEDPETELLNEIIKNMEKFRTELIEQYCGSEWFVICAEPMRLKTRVNNFKKYITDKMDDFDYKMNQLYTSYRRTKETGSQFFKGLKNTNPFTEAKNTINNLIKTINENRYAILYGTLLLTLFYFILWPAIAGAFGWTTVYNYLSFLVCGWAYYCGVPSSWLLEKYNSETVGSVKWSAKHLCVAVGTTQFSMGAYSIIQGYFTHVNNNSVIKNNIPTDSRQAFERIATQVDINQLGGSISSSKKPSKKSSKKSSKNYLNKVRKKETTQVGSSLAAVGLGIKALESLANIGNLASNMTLQWGQFGLNTIRAIPETVDTWVNASQEYPTTIGILIAIGAQITMILCDFARWFIGSNNSYGLHVQQGGGVQDVLWDIIERCVRFVIGKFISLYKDEDIDLSGGKKLNKSFKNSSSSKKNKSFKNRSSSGFNNQTGGFLGSLFTTTPPPPPPPIYKVWIDKVIDFIKNLYSNWQSINITQWTTDFFAFLSNHKIGIMMFVSLTSWIVKNVYNNIPENTKWDEFINKHQTANPVTKEASEEEINNIKKQVNEAHTLSKPELEQLYKTINTYMPYQLTSNDIIKEVNKQMKENQKLLNEEVEKELEKQANTQREEMDEIIIAHEEQKQEFGAIDRAFQEELARLDAEEKLLDEVDDSDDDEEQQEEFDAIDRAFQEELARLDAEEKLLDDDDGEWV